MAVCLSCALKYNVSGKMPEDKKFHRIIGWDGMCDKCRVQTKVFSNQDMGVNPEMRKDRDKL